MGADTFAVKK